MYNFKSRVRFSETGPDRKLSVSGLMNYLQDCSIFQSEDVGAGLQFMKKTQRAWLLSAWNVEVIRRPDIAEEIVIETWPYEFKGIYGLRNYAICDKNGNYLVKADSCWFLTDMETGRPVRPTAEDIAPYPVLEPRLDMEDLPRKIAVPGELEIYGQIKVLKHHLDINLHVNNVQYIDIACEVLPEGCEVSGVRAEYKRAAVLGDIIVIKYKKEEGKYFISLCAEDDAVYANVELKVNVEETEKM